MRNWLLAYNDDQPEDGGGGGEYASRSRGAAAGGNNFDQRMPEADPAAASSPISDEDIPF